MLPTSLLHFCLSFALLANLGLATPPTATLSAERVIIPAECRTTISRLREVVSESPRHGTKPSLPEDWETRVLVSIAPLFPDATLEYDAKNPGALGRKLGEGGASEAYYVKVTPDAQSANQAVREVCVIVPAEKRVIGNSSRLGLKEIRNKYRRVAAIYKKLADVKGALKYFPKLYPESRVNPIEGSELPALVFEYSKIGTLLSRVSKPEPGQPDKEFKNKSIWLDKIARTLEVLHSPEIGLVHLDVKPENFLVFEHDGEEVAVLSDLTETSKIGKPTEKTMITRGFFPADDHVHSRGSRDVQVVANKDQDLYALMVTAQIVLLGVDSYKEVGGPLSKARKRIPELEPRFYYSPYTYNQAVNKKLSAIAWFQFPSVEKYREAVKRAQEMGSDTAFFRDYFLPEVLRQFNGGKHRTQLAKLVLSSRELWDYYQDPSNPIGFTKEEKFAIEAFKTGILGLERDGVPEFASVPK